MGQSPLFPCTKGEKKLYADRLSLLKNIENRRRSRAILYVTGDRPGLKSKIHDDVYDYFVEILEEFGDINRISLILYTRGGDTLTAWSLVNLIRQYCKRFEVILPARALSAGTLISIGADRIVMTKQASLSPVDSSVQSPLNPTSGDSAPPVTLPINAETIKGYLDFALSQIGEKDPNAIKDLILQLADKIHPLVLGEAYRSAAQVQGIATKLLAGSGIEENKIEGIVSFLCSESGSHDYTIHRSEAHTLGLPVEKPHESLHSEIKALYADFAGELKLNQPWDPGRESKDRDLLTFSNKRCLLESTAGKAWFFATEGEIVRREGKIEVNRTFDGWQAETNT